MTIVLGVWDHGSFTFEVQMQENDLKPRFLKPDL